MTAVESKDSSAQTPEGVNIGGKNPYEPPAIQRPTQDEILEHGFNEGEPRLIATPPASEARVTWTLPSGAVASMVQGTGKHVRLASRLVGTETSALVLGMALATVKGLINGKPFTLEDMDQMSQEDVFSLVGKAMSGGKTPFSAPGT